MPVKKALGGSEAKQWTQDLMNEWMGEGNGRYGEDISEKYIPNLGVSGTQKIK